jgi:very-short-patch-repair endonuclease
MSPQQFFSHLTAAELWRLRMPEGFRSSALHVTSLAPMRAPRAIGIAGHQARSARVHTVGGLRASHPVDAWVDSSWLLNIDELVIMGDGLVSRKKPLATMEQLDAAVTAHRGRRGFVGLAAALPLLRANSDSARETMLRLVLARAGFPDPEVNGAVTNNQELVVAHGDLVYREFRTVVEYDGGQHRTDESQFDIDIERIDRMIDADWRVLRVGKALMRKRAELIAELAAILSARGWGGPELT